MEGSMAKRQKAKQGNRLPAIGYLRVSDDKSGEEKSTTLQRKLVIAEAEKVGWEIDIWHMETLSAFKRRKVKGPDGKPMWRVIRPEFFAMLEELRDGDVKNVMAYDLDRACRDPRDLEDLIDLAERGGVTAKSVTGSLKLDTDADITMARVLVAFNNKSSRDTARRVRVNHEERLVAGKFNGGTRRFGYTEGNKALVPDEAEFLAWAYRALDSGVGTQAIWRELERRGLTGTSGGKVPAASIARWLRTPHHAGLAGLRGKVVGKSEAPPVIDEDTWRRCQAILSDPARQTGAGRPSSSLLAGIVYCGACGSKAYSKSGHLRDGVRIPGYSCHAKGCCNRPQDAVDVPIIAAIAGLLALDAARLRPVAKPRPDSSASVIEAEQLRQRLADLADLMTAGDLDPRAYASASREMLVRLDALDARAGKESAHPATDALLRAADPAAAWTSMTTEQRRPIVKELIERIDIPPLGGGQYSRKQNDLKPVWREWVVDTPRVPPKGDTPK
jgi:DNA invertase Pin-like site-specific DNA recombinase